MWGYEEYEKECQKCGDKFQTPIPFDDICGVCMHALISQKCECGSASVGSPRHSNWCPLFVNQEEL